MNFEQYINKSTFYLLSLIVTITFGFYYYQQTCKKYKDIYWFIYEGDEKKFDINFCKKVFVHLIVVFFAFFTFFNVIYFCVEGKWVADNSFQSTRSFVIIGAVAYIFDLIEKSSGIIYDHKQKKIQVSQGDTKKGNTEESN